MSLRSSSGVHVPFFNPFVSLRGFLISTINIYDLKTMNQRVKRKLLLIGREWCFTWNSHHELSLVYMDACPKRVSRSIYLCLSLSCSILFQLTSPLHIPLIDQNLNTIIYHLHPFPCYHHLYMYFFWSNSLSLSRKSLTHTHTPKLK